MNLFRKIFGLGPKEPVNTKPKTSQVNKIEQPNSGLSLDDIFPALVSTKTQDYDLTNELVSSFHTREDNYADVVIAHVFADLKNIDKNNEYDISHIKNGDEEEDYYHMLLENGERNLDNFDLPFEFWNPSDKKLEYKILSCRLSSFASEKITSKKHMLEAHKLLDADELLVSIPRKGLIFVCDNNNTEENKKHFFNLHSYIVLKEDEELEVLCEDIFVVENGEINNVFFLTELSKILNSKE